MEAATWMIRGLFADKLVHDNRSPFAAFDWDSDRQLQCFAPNYKFYVQILLVRR